MENQNQENKQVEISPIDKAEKLLTAMEAQTTKYEELVQRQEKARVEAMLGGRAGMQAPPIEKKRELTPAEAVKNFGKNGINLKDPMPLVDA